MLSLRIATFNLENLDDGPAVVPPLVERIAIMRSQIERIDADVLCLQEVHSQELDGNRLLSALDKLLKHTRYDDPAYSRAVTVTTGGDLYKQRNLVTISRFPIEHMEMLRDSSGPQPSYKMVTSDPPDNTCDPIGWERPMLYTRINCDGTIIHLINLHLKSKIAAGIPGGKIDNYTWRSISAWAEGSFIASMKRLGQALQARLWIDALFDEDPRANIALCGDFNAGAGEIPLRAICGHVEDTGNPDHAPRILIPCENNIPVDSRFSLYHLGRGEMLDHIIVSRHLFRYFKGAEIHNEVLPDESGAFRQDSKFPESDHAPVVGLFNIL